MDRAATRVIVRPVAWSGVDLHVEAVSKDDSVHPHLPICERHDRRIDAYDLFQRSQLRFPLPCGFSTARWSPVGACPPGLLGEPGPRLEDSNSRGVR